MIHDDSSDDLRTKSKRALKAILAKCTHLQVSLLVPKPGLSEEEHEEGGGGGDRGGQDSFLQRRFVF